MRSCPPRPACSCPSEALRRHPSPSGTALPPTANLKHKHAVTPPRRGEHRTGIFGNRYTHARYVTHLEMAEHWGNTCNTLKTLFRRGLPKSSDATVGTNTNGATPDWRASGPAPLPPKRPLVIATGALRKC